MSFGGSPSMMTPTETAPSSAEADAQAAEAAKKKKAQLAAKKGLSSTILTGEMGLTGDAPGERKTILGQ